MGGGELLSLNSRHSTPPLFLLCRSYTTAVNKRLRLVVLQPVQLTQRERADLDRNGQRGVCRAGRAPGLPHPATQRACTWATRQLKKVSLQAILPCYTSRTSLRSQWAAKSKNSSSWSASYRERCRSSSVGLLSNAHDDMPSNRRNSTGGRAEAPVHVRLLSRQVPVQRGEHVTRSCQVHLADPHRSLISSPTTPTPASSSSAAATMAKKASSASTSAALRRPS